MLTKKEEEYLTAGRSYFKKKLYKEALAEFSVVVCRYPETATNCFWYALAQYKCGNCTEAIKYYQKAISYDPKNVRFYNACALAYRKTNNFMEAGLCHTQAIQLNPAYAYSFFTYGRTCIKDKNYALAREFFQKAIALKPNIMKYTVALAKVCEALGDYKTATACYERVIEQEPENFDCYLACARAHHQNNNNDKSDLYYNQAMQLAKKSYDKTGNADSFIDYVVSFFEQNPDKNGKKTIRLLEAIGRDNPHPVVFYNLGYVYSLQNNLFAAIANYSAAISMNFVAAHEKLYVLLKEIKPEYRFPDEIPGIWLSKLTDAILTHPDRLKKTDLLGFLLNDEHPLGKFFFQHITNVQYIEYLISKIPCKQVREQYLTRAVVWDKGKESFDKQDTLYKICHPTSITFEFFTSNEKVYVEQMRHSLELIQKEKMSKSEETAFVRISQQKALLHVKFDSLLTEISRSSNPGLQMRMRGCIIRQFDEAAQLEAGASIAPKYHVFIYAMKAENVYHAIMSRDLSGIVYSRENRKRILFNCLNPDTILGKKFLIKDNKKLVEQIILALPEITTEDKEEKITLLKRALYKQETLPKQALLYEIMHHARYGGSVSPLKEGTLKTLTEALERLELELQNPLDACGKFYTMNLS